MSLLQSKAFFLNHYFNQMYLAGLRLRTTITAAVYRKVGRM